MGVGAEYGREAHGVIYYRCIYRCPKDMVYLSFVSLLTICLDKGSGLLKKVRHGGITSKERDVRVNMVYWCRRLYLEILCQHIRVHMASQESLRECSHRKQRGSFGVHVRNQLRHSSGGRRRHMHGIYTTK